MKQVLQFTTRRKRRWKRIKKLKKSWKKRRGSRVNFITKRNYYVKKIWPTFEYSRKRRFRWVKKYAKHHNKRLDAWHQEYNIDYKWSFYWRRNKITKNKKFWQNFTYVLKTILPTNYSKPYIWAEWGKGGKPDQFIFKSKRKPKRKLPIRQKDTFKKKIIIKKFLIKKYNFKKIYQLKNLHSWSKKIPGNNIINFYLSLESQLSTVCVRMHFFWTLNTARVWINIGMVYVNGRLIKFPRHLTKISDLVTVLIYPILWTRHYAFWLQSWYKRKTSRYLNGCELSYKASSAIIFYLPYKIEDIKLFLKKQRKHWIKTRFFSFLVNSFY
jgi:ribosomal protein S4